MPPLAEPNLQDCYPVSYHPEGLPFRTKSGMAFYRSSSSSTNLSSVLQNDIYALLQASKFSNAVDFG